jgi:hypothetical protein
LTVREAYDASTSLNDLAGHLGCHYQTARKMAKSEGLAVPASHWGRKPAPEVETPDAEPLTAEEQFAEDKTIARLKAELADTRKLYAAAVKSSNEDVLEAARAVMGKVTPTRVLPPQVGRGSITEDAILTWADWHGGEVIDFDVMQGFNSYSPAIMCRRAQYTVDRTLKLLFDCHTGTTFEALHVFDLGDSITGDLLDDNKATNALPVFESMRLVAQVKAVALTELSQYIPVTYTSIPGNHGRRSAKMPWKQPTETADWLIGEMIGDLTSTNDRVTVVVPKAWTAVVEVRGHFHSLNHGYSAARGGYGGIPWYAFQRADGKLTALESSHGRRVHYRWYGHIHQSADLPKMDGVGKQFIVGSLKGGDEYALNELGSYSDPVQNLVGCHEDVGVSWRYELNVNRADGEPSRYEELL